METALNRNPLNLIGKLPLTGFESTMNHLSAMLDGATYCTGTDEDDMPIIKSQCGITDYIFPGEDIEILEDMITENSKATLFFTTIGLPFYFLLSTLKIVFDTVKAIINTTILHAIPPIAVIIGSIAKLKSNKKYTIIGPAAPLTVDDVSTIISNKITYRLENPMGDIVEINKKGFRGSKLLTSTYHTRITDTDELINRIFRVPTQYIDQLIINIDKSPLLKTISWVLFPLRYAVSLIRTGVEAVDNTLALTLKTISYPVVGIVHVFSLIKYRAFRNEMKTIEYAEVNDNDLGEYMITIEELTHKDSSYKTMFNNKNLHTNTSLVKDDEGIYSLQNCEPNNPRPFKINITEENCNTLFKALLHNTYGWAEQLNENDQLDDAVKVLKGLNEDQESDSSNDLLLSSSLPSLSSNSADI